MEAIVRDVMWFAIGLTVFLAFIFYIIKRREQGRILKTRVELFSKLHPSSSISYFFNEIAQRTYVFYYSFIFHQIISLICGSFSLIFSISTFAILLLINKDAPINYVVPLLAILFTVIVLFVKPQKFKSQYLKAFRKLDSCCLEIIALMSSSGYLEGNVSSPQDKKILDEIIGAKNEVENSLTLDEE